MAWDIAGKTVIITGATSGIGLEAGVALAGQGARPVIVGRHPDRLAAAVHEIKAKTGVGAPSYLCDFSSQAEIRRLAVRLLDDHPRIDVLVNNAGGVNTRRELTVDGIERTFATNHLGYFLLTSLLLERIRQSAPARIVSVASVGHRRGTMDLDDPGFERGGYWIMRAYCRSKLANVLFAGELARRLAGTGVTSNSVHPGSVATRIWSHAPWWTKPLIYLVLRRRFISPAEGARTIVQLAASPDVDGLTGRYFEDQQAVPPAPLAQDEQLACALWDLSERLTGTR